MYQRPHNLLEHILDIERLLRLPTLPIIRVDGDEEEDNEDAQMTTLLSPIAASGDGTFIQFPSDTFLSELLFKHYASNEEICSTPFVRKVNYVCDGMAKDLKKVASLN